MHSFQKIGFRLRYISAAIAQIKTAIEFALKGKSSPELP